MGKIFVISVVSHRQSKTLINNTALEVDDMNSTFIELYEIVKSRPRGAEIPCPTCPTRTHNQPDK